MRVACAGLVLALTAVGCTEGAIEHAPSTLQTLPLAVEFGPATLGAPQERSVLLRNASRAPMRIVGFRSTLRELEILDEPFVLEGGGEREVRVRFTAQMEGLLKGQLLVETDVAAIGVQAVEVSGIGMKAPVQLLPPPLIIDRWVQAPQTKVDMLFVIDNSVSMIEEQQNLGANFAALKSAANAAGVDYHIGVTTTGIEPAAVGSWLSCPGGAMGGEGGRLYPVDGSSPRVITVKTPDSDRVFERNVQVGACHWNEQGLEGAYRALSPPLVDERDDPRTPVRNDGNDGFIRDDARLAIIFLTDEEDFSPRPLAEYESFFKSLKKNDPAMLTISAIAGPADLTTCPTASSTGTRYIALAKATGGVIENICTKDLSRSLESLSSNAFGLLREFPLTHTPQSPEQIIVTVNGTQVLSGWSYDAAKNSIVFESAAMPRAGTNVEVSYASAG